MTQQFDFISLIWQKWTWALEGFSPVCTWCCVGGPSVFLRRAALGCTVNSSESFRVHSGDAGDDMLNPEQPRQLQMHTGGSDCGAPPVLWNECWSLETCSDRSDPCRRDSLRLQTEQLTLIHHMWLTECDLSFSLYAKQTTLPVGLVVGFIMLVHQLNRHQTSTNQHRPAWKSCWSMLIFPAGCLQYDLTFINTNKASLCLSASEFYSLKNVIIQCHARWLGASRFPTSPGVRPCESWSITPPSPCLLTKKHQQISSDLIYSG